jgi:hypothetical protein
MAVTVTDQTPIAEAFEQGRLATTCSWTLRGVRSSSVT